MKELLGAVGGGRGGRKGKGRKKGGMKDGRRGFDVKLGHGKDGVRWPGLSFPIRKMEPGKWYNDDQLEMKEVSEETEEENDVEFSTVLSQDLQTGKRYRRRLSETNWTIKGWTGKSWGGRHVGCPETPDGNPLLDFQSIVIERKRVVNQTKGGKRRSVSTVVVVGNGKGAAGFAVGKGDDVKTALRKAKNSAVNYLQLMPRCDDHTIFHNIDTKYCASRVIMRKAVQGTGLQCNRVIAAICNLVGIKDLRAKVVGSTNPLNVVRATFKGLSSQQTHQRLANNSGKYIVEMRPETGYRPVVIAIPNQFKKEMKPKLEKLQLLSESAL